MTWGAGTYVDTHVHFFDLDDPVPLQWGWHDVDQPPSLARELSRTGLRRFTPPDLWTEGHRLAGLSKVVHVQSTTDADPVGETRWLAALQERYGAPHAAIARVALRELEAPGVLERHLEFPLVRGVRDHGATTVLREPIYVNHVRRLGELGLLFEIFCSPKRYADLAALARDCPHTTIVLEHFGLAPLPSSDAHTLWRERLTELSACENVRLKLSGLALSGPDWTFDDARVLVATALDAFGVERCVVGSNWPIDRPSCAYPDSVRAVAAATSDLSASERHLLFAGNAEALYAI
jgi:predicted TIM-barrel fold metal-dependent hydrolase